VGLERGPLSLVSTIEELLLWKSSGSGLETREYGRRDPSHWPRGTFYLQKLELTSPTSGGSSVGIVRSRTQATEFSFWSPIFLNNYSSFDCDILNEQFSVPYKLPHCIDTCIYSTTLEFYRPPLREDILYL
jgi:hypothetical protein